MNSSDNKKKKTVLIAIIIAVLLIIAIIVAIVLINNNGSKENNMIDGSDTSDYANNQNTSNETYLKMAKEIWKKEVVLLEAVKSGDIKTLVENARADEYMIDDFLDNPDQEFVDAASEYLKFMYADLTWTDPDEERYEDWAKSLEREINAKMNGDQAAVDWISLSTYDLIKGRNFYKIYSTYGELYPDATREWNNETTSEAYEILKATLNKIPIEDSMIDIHVLEFDAKGNFVLAYDSLLGDTEIESLHNSYWLRDRYGDDSWVGHFIMEDVLD